MAFNQRIGTALRAAQQIDPNLFASPAGGELIRRLTSGDYWKLRHVTRWSGFCFSPEWIDGMRGLIGKGDYSMQAWQPFLVDTGEINGELAGDGNVFSHQLAQAYVIARYAKHDVGREVVPGYRLSQEDYLALQILGLCHDNGELAEGDVLYDAKAGGIDRRVEQACGYSVLESLDFPQEHIELVKWIYDIDFTQGHPLKSYFSLLEKLSYMRGALCAFYGVQEKTPVFRARGLMHNVLKNQMQPLLRAEQDGMRSVTRFLDDCSHDINAMFVYLDGLSYRTPHEADNRAYGEARAAWQLRGLERAEGR